MSQFHPQEFVLFALLILLEIALSVDNLAGMREKLISLPERLRFRTSMLASITGLGVRVALVVILVHVGKLLDPFFINTIFGSGRVVLLALGGGFLVVKATGDLRQHLDKGSNPVLTARLRNNMPSLGEIIIYDALLSIDSVVAALALANNLALVLAAMMVAHVFLNIFWKQIDNFFLCRPQLMTLTLCFLFALGFVSLVRIMGMVLAEETLIIALGFGLAVELLNGKTVEPKSRATLVARLQKAPRKIEPRPGSPQSATVGQQSDLESTGEIEIFVPQTCTTCSSTTFSAFSFCMSCGTSVGAEAHA